MAENWFQKNAPQQGNWFAANAPDSAPSGPPTAAGMPAETHPAGLPAGVSLPGLPGAPAASTTQAGQDTTHAISGDKLFGQNTLSDSLATVGGHLKNMVTGTYHAAADQPQGKAETAANLLGPGALPLYRTLVKPSVQAIQQMPSSKNATDVMNHFTDAIPIVGPWSRQIENDAQQHGVVPALLGAATDMAGPKLGGKLLAASTRGAGFGLQMGAATDASRNLAATRLLTAGTPGELLQSALKPGVKYGAGVAEQLEKSIPSILQADPAAKGVSGFAAAADKAKDASFEPYNNLLAPYRQPAGGIGPVRPSAITGEPLADAQMESIPFMDLVDRPGKGGISGQTAEKADNYRRDFSAPQVDALREDANGKLNAFYNKQGGDRAAALSNPETARVKAVGDTARQQLYPFLEQNAGLQPGTVADLQQKYGQLSDVANIANKREPVFARHDPVTLSQKIVSGHGNPLNMAWNYLVQNKLGELTNSDALVNSAIDRFQNPEQTPLVPRPGLLPQAAGNLGSGLRAVKSPPLLVNPFFLAPASGQK